VVVLRERPARPVPPSSFLPFFLMSSTTTRPPAGPLVPAAPVEASATIDLDTVRSNPTALLPIAVTAVAFAVLFAHPFRVLLLDWWTLPEAGHGLLLGPVAIWLAWKAGLLPDRRPNVALGLTMIVAAVVIRFASGLAAELFTMRCSMILALGGIVVYFHGYRQLLHWWLPFLLFCLSVPLPELVTQAIALPLQFKASQMGAALLETRNIPVRLTGNVIRLPGHELFVTEACSGLRSLTALISTAVLTGAIAFRFPVTRVLLLVLAIPVAIAINGVRVFLTGFLVYFVSPEFGKGFMHMTEGWLLFLVSLGCVAVMAWILRMIERNLGVHPSDV
jgi:exosortase